MVMIKADISKNPITGKFECVIYIEGGDAMKFADSRIISPFAAIPFEIQFSGDTEIHKAVIANKKPESGPIESPNQWLIEGYFVENRQKFKGYYNTRTHKGYIQFSD